MELKILLSIATSLLGGLFGQVLSDHEQTLPQKPVLVQVQQVTPRKLSVPSFVTEIPSEHFVGVSVPCNSLAEARNAAISDAIRQILSAVNASYAHQYLDQISGNVRKPVRIINDQLSKVANGIVLGAERCIVKNSWSQDAAGRYVYFILVRYPDRLLSEMRRLSKGAKLVCCPVRFSDNEVELLLSEVNGVAVTVSSVDIKVRKINRFAPFISYFIMKVPKGSQGSYSRAIRPVRICGESCRIRFNLNHFDKKASDYILGSQITVDAVIRGHDEIGRMVTAKVDI